MDIYKANSEDYPAIIDVWETSVRATHHFLKEEDILFYKSRIATLYLPAVNLFYLRNTQGDIIAFIGIVHRSIEMLFIRPEERGKGLGKELITFAINQHQSVKVDVNEQNEQAIGFYNKMGFKVISRDNIDSEGKPYPILHMQLTEQHPLGFFLPENTQLLMLGSFPPPKVRWSMNFYYPNIQNDMWRILGLLFYNSKDHFLETKKTFSEEKAKAFCNSNGVGIGDTAMEIVRQKDNASDKFLEVVKPINPKEILSQIPGCKAIVVTGQKAMETLLSVLPEMEEPKVGSFTEFTLLQRNFRLYRMPSSSRAYPKPLEEKAEVYKKMFVELGML